MPFQLTPEKVREKLIHSGLFSEIEADQFLKMPEEDATAWACKKLPPGGAPEPTFIRPGVDISLWEVSLRRGILLREIGAPGFTSPPGMVWSPTTETPKY